jgi:hypothetical protein
MVFSDMVFYSVFSGLYTRMLVRTVTMLTSAPFGVLERN